MLPPHSYIIVYILLISHYKHYDVSKKRLNLIDSEVLFNCVTLNFTATSAVSVKLFSFLLCKVNIFTMFYYSTIANEENIFDSGLFIRILFILQAKIFVGFQLYFSSYYQTDDITTKKMDQVHRRQI